MAASHASRRLAGILAADLVGYSRLMAADEAWALAQLKAHRNEVIEPLAAKHRGRVIKLMGDGTLMEFASVVDAVAFALDMQTSIRERNVGLSEDRKILYRIGINIGDIVIEGDDIFGDGVNVAARLEALAPAGGICISRQVADEIAGKLDVTFANAGRHRLKNIAKPVEIWFWPPERASAARRLARRWQRAAAVLALAVFAAGVLTYFTVDTAGDRMLPTGPRILLIPFENLGNDPDDAFFSDGLTRDINTYLSKFSNLFVIAPEAGLAYRENADCAQIRQDLDADYILTGTVRRSLAQIRVTTEFTDAQTCRQLASPGPFDRDLSLENVLEIQLEIAQQVAAAVGSADAPLFNAEVQRTILHEAPENLAAYECVLLQYWYYETFAPERFLRARACLENAVKVDPDYSRGWSSLAAIYLDSKKYAIETPANWAELSREAAEKAINLDPDNANAYHVLATRSQMLGDDPEVFRKFAEHAIELNPNDTVVLADLGTWFYYAGEWERGMELMMRAKLLNPNHQSWWDWIFLLDHYRKGEYEQARDVGLKIDLPNNYVIQAGLTAIYGMLGDQENAEAALAHLLEIKPNYPDDPRAPFRARGFQTELIEALMEGLRKAGLQVPPATAAD